MTVRKIKFRAWDKANRRMHEPSHNLLVTSFSGEPYWCFGYEQPTPMDCEVMQFTGICDCNGKEIYEGDIIKWDEQEWGNPFSELVRWDYEFLCARESDWPQWCEVIGNRHENPELLKTIEQ